MDAASVTQCNDNLIFKILQTYYPFENGLYIFFQRTPFPQQRGQAWVVGCAVLQLIRKKPGSGKRDLEQAIKDLIIPREIRYEEDAEATAPAATSKN